MDSNVIDGLQIINCDYNISSRDDTGHKSISGCMFLLHITCS